LFRNFFRFTAGGIKSQDTAHIAGVEVQNLSFCESTRFYKRYMGLDRDLGGYYDGVVGLAPAGNNGPTYPACPLVELNNLFLSMIAQDLLDRNIFSLKLSRGLDDSGEIMFGGINQDLFEGYLTTLPLLNSTIEPEDFHGRWFVPATSISIGRPTGSLGDFVAIFESDLPAIFLPQDWVIFLEVYLGMEAKGSRFGLMSIGCAKRDG
jgi:saccharopepsin